jgi:hypothetical protein
MSKDRSPATLFSRTIGTRFERFLLGELQVAAMNLFGIDLVNRLN